MNTIFIEAEKRDTAEQYFLNALIKKFFPEAEYEFIYMRGVANLFNEVNLNLLRSKTAEGIKCLVILDADTLEKGWVMRSEKRMLRRTSDVKAWISRSSFTPTTSVMAMWNI